MADVAPQQVNIDGDLLKIISARMANPDVNMYDEARARVFELLKTDSFRKFRQSSMYREDGAYLEHEEEKGKQEFKVGLCGAGSKYLGIEHIHKI